MDNATRFRVSPRNRRILLWILLLASAAEFVWRGPARYSQATAWSDLSQNYAAARIWLRGQNFANPENFVALWRDEVHATLSAETVRTHLAPPPGALLLMAPIAALQWPAAKVVWLVLLMAGFALTVWSLVKTADFQFKEPRTLAYIAGCLALAPFHTGIASANQTILIVGLCSLGIWAASARRDVFAGLLFGVACSLKPQLGSFLVLYYLVQRRWRLFATALGLTVGLALIAMAWMRICGVAWAQDYFQNINVLAVHNKIDDFTSVNPIRFLLINLQVPVYSFTRSARISNIVALSAGFILTCVWAFLVVKSCRRVSELLAVGTISVICLMPVYHRLYDASLLAIPLCWCFTWPVGRLRSVAKLALFTMTPFLVPGPAVLQQLAAHGHIPMAWTASGWWQDFVMPHQTWLLLWLCLILIYGMFLESGLPETSTEQFLRP